MADTLQHAFNKVCNVSGFESLNMRQEKFIKYIVQGRKDIFVNLPTGFGKSLIYQALLLVYSCLQSTDEKNIIIVISPRNCLIKHQVLRLNSQESLPYLWLKSPPKSKRRSKEWGIFNCLWVTWTMAWRRELEENGNERVLPEICQSGCC